MSNIVGVHNVIGRCFTVRCLQFSSLILNFPAKKWFCTFPDENNPLFNIHKLPRYKQINGEAVKEAIPVLVGQVEKDIKILEDGLQKKETLSWEEVVPMSEKVFDPLSLAWKAVAHLHSVKNNPSLRTAYHEVQPDVVAVANRISQSAPLYRSLKILQDNKGLDEAQYRIIESSLRSAEHSGVHLEGKLKEEFNEISKELAALGTKFMNNVLDSTKEFSYLIHDKRELDGLPDNLLSLMAVYAGQELNETVDPSRGPWKISLDMPCFDPFMTYSTNSSIRELVYKAYVERASKGDFNNSEIIERIRELRKRKSDILGHKNYADLSLESKMAKTPQAVWEMIQNLSHKAKPKAVEELQRLKEFAASNGAASELRHWDLAYWSEKQKEALLSLNEEKLREYFPLPRVLNGLFSLSQELFGISIREENPAIEAWDEDVKFFNIYNEDGQRIASFFLDLYVRSGEKNSGAWMNSALDRDDALNREPIAYLICNQSPPVGNAPSLMTFREVRTLFHEFGHGLQHMLTNVKYPSAAGINNIEWDAVELPSQFMENWLYDEDTLLKLTSHYKTGDTLPKDMIQRIKQGKNYHAAMAMMRQLYFSALDLELHTKDEPWRDVMRRVANEYSVMEPLQEDHFPCSFAHIFFSGYAAGYYSYKWAEVLSADAFAAFEEVGLQNRKDVIVLGKRFRDTVLARGGSRHPRDIFADFRGRQPKVESLLKSYGLDS